MQRQLLRHPSRIRSRHDVAAPWRLHGRLRNNRVTERHMPHGRLGSVIERSDRPRDIRMPARVSVPKEINRPHMRPVLILQRDGLSAQFQRPCISRAFLRQPPATLASHHVDESHDDVMSHAHPRRIVLPRMRLDQQRQPIV